MTYERIKYYYTAGLWNNAMVKKAVKKGVITKDQYKEITGEDYGSSTSATSEKAAAYDILMGVSE